MKKSAKKIIRVAELFAGVGGFRIGLEGYPKKRYSGYEVVWSSQWEPGASTQHASDIYVERFGGDNHSCEDIAAVIEKKFDSIPDHDLLVGGFPCQDYSVARTLSHAKGLEGKKGVLWWSIYDILKKKKKSAPDYLMLENVDRLLKSPASQRGRDFSVMLASLSSLGYAVEWRVINAAEYGFPQRRRRVYILGYRKGTTIYDKIKKCKDIKMWFEKEGVMAKAFKIKRITGIISEFRLDKDVLKLSKNFSLGSANGSPFKSAGVMIGGHVFTEKVEPEHKGEYKVLGDYILDEKEVPPEFFITSKTDLKRWEYLKGRKYEVRRTKAGFEYNYNEGAMVFPDSLKKPSRTIVTGEGGNSPSRFKHVIRTKSGRLRRLTPIELERLNMFPDEHTAGVSNTRRAFIMGNALVVGVIDRLGVHLKEMIDSA